MIVKEFSPSEATDKFSVAGQNAEKQMAYYLSRAFKEDPSVHVFNNVRFERNGDVAQIDHLVLHNFGFVLVESKSVTGTIEVNKWMEFTRISGYGKKGMDSPILQVDRQRQLFQELLKDNKERLRRKVMLGMAQGTFGDERFNTFVAISDQGVINRRGANPKELVKADQVPNEIKAIIKKHSRAAGFGGLVRGAFGGKKVADEIVENSLPRFTSAEFDAISKFILENHSDAVAPATAAQTTSLAGQVAESRQHASQQPTVRPTLDHRCRHCAKGRLILLFGKFGYYFKCLDCDGNTKVYVKCPKCSNETKLVKSGSSFTRHCSTCQNEEHFFTNPDQNREATSRGKR